jgi:hypothetical protein
VVPALELGRRACVVREHEHRMVEWRVLSPPPVPRCQPSPACWSLIDAGSGPGRFRSRDSLACGLVAQNLRATVSSRSALLQSGFFVYAVCNAFWTRCAVPLTLIGAWWRPSTATRIKLT